MADLTLTLPALRQAYAGGLSPMAVIEQVYARIAEIGDDAIFLCLFDKYEVLQAAQALGAYNPDKPLWGVPFAIKDNIDAAGKPTTAACPAFEYNAKTDAFVVDRLKEAGALLIGKTNLDQFATGLVGVRSPFGVPKNPIDPDIVPGGSSSGSAVSVAHGIVSFALGTDTAGSGRVPAAVNNIVGLKPTLGALSATGLVPACRTLDTISIFALTVEDAYTAYQAAAGFDPADSYSRVFESPDLVAPSTGTILGIPDPASIQFFDDDLQKEAYYDAVTKLAEAGFEIREIDFSPFYAVAEMLYYGAWVAERYAVVEDMIRTQPDEIFPVTLKIIKAAEQLSAADAFRGIYRLKDLIREAEPVLDGIDVLCVPTIPTFYSVADLQADPVTPNSNLGTYTNFVNLMDMCGMAVPAPARSDGRPGSLTFLAPAGQDAKVASLATLVEAMGERQLGATGWDRPEVDLPTESAEETIDIAVCGAHMSGLPLNHTLTERGATMISAARTAPDYAFFALPDGEIARPGLVRVADGAGTEIALEIWRMPSTAFGGFMKTIPAPLSIGSIRLSDGGEVQGFLCEAIATETAKNISDLGDWRLYAS